jgi:hypothetical protein
MTGLRGKRSFLWAATLVHLVLWIVFLAEVVLEAGAVDATIYGMFEALHGPPAPGATADIWAQMGRFVSAWWWVGALVLFNLVSLLILVYIVFWMPASKWVRLGWFLGWWFVPTLLFCAIELWRLRDASPTDGRPVSPAVA